MIESIQIKNFRGIREGQIEGFRKFNLLVGPNNSGKSAVLEMLYLANTTDRMAQISDKVTSSSHGVNTSDSDLLGHQPILRTLERHSQDIAAVRATDFKGAKVQVVEAAAALPNFNISFLPVSKRHLPNQEDVIALFGLETSQNVSTQNDDSILVFQLAKGLGLAGGARLYYCWLPSLVRYGGSHSTWSVSGGIPQSEHTLLCDVQTMLEHLPMDFFRRTIQTVPGWTQKIAKHFSTIFGIEKPFNVQFFPVDQDQQFVQGWIAPSDQVALTIDNYGDGARHAFKVLTPLLALRELVREDAPGLFLWEEPELFQNPQTLARLLTEVAVLLKDKPIQVFIATHSLEAVANFVELVREGQLAEAELATICLNLQEGSLRSFAFDATEVQQWTEMGLDPRVPNGKVDSPLLYQFRETANAAEHTDSH